MTGEVLTESVTLRVGDEWEAYTQQPPTRPRPADGYSTHTEGLTMTEQEVIDAICAGPPPKMAGVIGDTAGRLTDVARIAKAVVGELRVKGLSLGDILSVLVMIGTFIAEHGDDIQAIVDKVLALFGKK